MKGKIMAIKEIPLGPGLMTDERDAIVLLQEVGIYVGKSHRSNSRGCIASPLDLLAD